MSIDEYGKTQRLLKENIFKRIKECVIDYYTYEEYGKNPIERRIYISEIGNVAIADMPYFITSQEKKEHGLKVLKRLAYEEYFTYLKDNLLRAAKTDLPSKRDEEEELIPFQEEFEAKKEHLKLVANVLDKGDEEDAIILICTIPSETRADMYRSGEVEDENLVSNSLEIHLRPDTPLTPDENDEKFYSTLSINMYSFLYKLVTDTYDETMNQKKQSAASRGTSLCKIIPFPGLPVNNE